MPSAKAKSTTSSSRKGKSKKKSAFPFRRWPSKWLWVGGLLAALLYVFVYYQFVTPFSFRWKSYYGEPVYPDGFEVRGIDVSHHQGKIDWERLRNARINGVPVSFVIIKATEGLSLADECFQRNFMQARRNEIVRGAYHYFKPAVDARRQAHFFLQTAALEPGDLPPVLDVEEVGGLTTENLRKSVKTWLDIVEREYNVKPMIYTGRRFKDDYLYGKDFEKYPLWLAHYYTKEMEYKGKWVIWQHTDVGEVDGIKGRVDCDIFNGSAADMDSILIKEQ